MGLGYTEEIVSKVAPARLFRAGIMDLLELAPKLLPETIVGVEILEGDGGPGTVLQVNYTEAVPGGSMKERVEMIDPANFEATYTMYDGGPFGKKLESAVQTMKLVPLPDGGCVYRTAMELKVFAGVEFTKEDMQMVKARDFGQFRAVEAYLLANPTACA